MLSECETIGPVDIGPYWTEHSICKLR